MSLYTSTKESNELIVDSTYILSFILNPATDLRFFTVYGPMERRLKSLTTVVLRNDLYRDFKYIDDIVYWL